VASAQGIGRLGKLKAGENGAVDLLGRPAADMTAATQEDLEEADEGEGCGS
jgi:hypothetical protein